MGSEMCIRDRSLADEAANAVDRKKPGHAMRLYTDAIDHFMKAILEHRRKQNTAT